MPDQYWPASSATATVYIGYRTAAGLFRAALQSCVQLYIC